MVWTHKHALFFLQGASVQQLIGFHYLVLKARPTKPFDPQLGLHDVVLAEVAHSPELSRLEVFELLMPDA